MGTYNRVVDHLHDELTLARRELACADMIDSTARREQEVAYWKHRVGKLEDQIKEADLANDPVDPVNLAGSGPMPIEPREG